jgi:hypothetical protein
VLAGAGRVYAFKAAFRRMRDKHSSLRNAQTEKFGVSLFLLSFIVFGNCFELIVS